MRSSEIVIHSCIYVHVVMQNVGEKLCDEEVEEMLKAVGADPTGITYEAFEKLVAT